DEATDASAARGRSAGAGPVVGLASAGTGAELQHGSFLLLPLLLLPTQLLAEHFAHLAGASRPALRQAAGLYVVPGLPGDALALRSEPANELLPRLPFLAGSVLNHRTSPTATGRSPRGYRRAARCLMV